MAFVELASEAELRAMQDRLAKMLDGGEPISMLAVHYDGPSVLDVIRSARPIAEKEGTVHFKPIHPAMRKRR